MIKDIRKAFDTFWSSQFSQVLIFTTCIDMSSFKSQGIGSYHKHVLEVFLCRNQVSKLTDIIKMCEINFLSEIALKCHLERLSMQKRVTLLLKGECFAPPSAMNHKMHCAEQILAWTWDCQVSASGAKHSPLFSKCLMG